MEIKIGNDVTVAMGDLDTVALDILDATGRDGESIEGGAYLFLSTAHATQLAHAILKVVDARNKADAEMELPNG